MIGHVLGRWVVPPALKALTKVNEWFLHSAGGAARPTFLDIDRTIPALRVIDEAYAEIRAEALAILGRPDGVPTYTEIDPIQDCIADVTPGHWRIFYLWAMGRPADPNCRRCPATMAAVSRVPGLFQAYFSILDAGKSVPPHRALFNSYLRYHLGLVVPAVDPPSLRVGGDVRFWEDGRSLLFDDTWEHEVVNNAAQPRMVLIVDVLRPMPRLQTLVNRALVPVAWRFYGRPVLRQAREYAARHGAGDGA